MTTKGFTRNFKPLEILTEEQVEAIHRGILDVLENTGVRVEHDRAIKLFKKNGCQVDYNERRVRIPAGLVEECLRKTPSSFHVKARDPKNDLQMGGNTCYFAPFPGMRTTDLDTWEARPATRKERDDGCIVLDALDNVHCCGGPIPYFETEGIPPAMATPEAFAALLRNSTKIQISSHQLGCEVFNIAMAKAAGTETFGLCLLAPPLTFPADTVESLFRGIEAGLPVMIGGAGIMGSVIPATIAGATVVTVTQNISGMVLAQLIKPGTRILCSGNLYSGNMRNGAPIFGSIEGALEIVIYNQIWRKYGAPTLASQAGPSSSKKIDFQCGYEKATNALMAALSGTNFISLHGCIHGELISHPVQSVLADDIAGIVGRFLDGVLVNNETLAVDLIKAVGPIPGMYLDKAHTRQWWQKEQFIPKAADRLTYPEWLEKGKKSALDYAQERVEEILATHKPKPLTASQDEEVDRILVEARAHYKKNGMM